MKGVGQHFEMRSVNWQMYSDQMLKSKPLEYTIPAPLFPPPLLNSLRLTSYPEANNYPQANALSNHFNVGHTTRVAKAQRRK